MASAISIPTSRIALLGQPSTALIWCLRSAETGFCFKRKVAASAQPDHFLVVLSADQFGYL